MRRVTLLLLTALSISLIFIPMASLSAQVEGEQAAEPFETYLGDGDEPIQAVLLQGDDGIDVIFSEEGPKEEAVIDFEFKDADIRDVFRTLSRISGVNIILDSNISGKATLSLKKIAFIDAVDLITKAYGYEYKYISGTLIVATPLRIKSSFGDAEVTEVFKIKYADPKKIMSIVDIVIPAEKLRLDERSRSIIASGTPRDLDRLSYLISKLDTRKRSIEIQARIEEISLNALNDLGIDWKDISMNINRTSSGAIQSVTFDFMPVLKLLEKEGKARLISNQRVRVDDGESATVLVGDKIPVLIREETANGNVIERYEHFDAGIKLSVTPIITDEGYVDLTIKPEISSIHEITDQNLPWLKTRELVTMVKVRDGDTVAIGGLLQTDESKDEYKVPLLGDIPIIGGLFRRENTSLKETELIIFVTVWFVDELPAE